MTNREQVKQELRLQTFGFELECYGITREDAAKAIAYFFGTPTSVCHAGGTYDKWVCKDDKGRRWEVASDGSIEDVYERRAEVVSPVLGYSDFAMVGKLVDELRDCGAKSDSAHKCGIHIHVGIGGPRPHTPSTIRNLVNMMAAHEAQLARAIRLDPFREGYCENTDARFLKELNAKKPKDWGALAKIWYEGNGCAVWDWRDHYSDSRYHKLNLHPAMSWKMGGDATYGGNHAKPTVEFRLFQFNDTVGICGAELQAFIHLALGMSAKAKLSKTCSARPQQEDNDKYAARCWLLQLGFIGPEFAKSREVLAQYLTGNCAWRTAR